MSDRACSLCGEQCVPLRPCEFAGCVDSLCDPCSIVHGVDHEDDCEACGMNYQECRCGEEEDG